jgi:hypothetical protein
VRLIPKEPPGRVNRKARAFETEIARLRAEGYTCEAIRTALHDVGVQVSLSTVQREAIRSSSMHRSAVASVAVPRSDTVRAPSPSPAYSPPGLVSDPRTSKEIAAEFVSKRINNRLLRERTQP